MSYLEKVRLTVYRNMGKRLPGRCEARQSRSDTARGTATEHYHRGNRAVGPARLAGRVLRCQSKAAAEGQKGEGVGPGVVRPDVLAVVLAADRAADASLCIVRAVRWRRTPWTARRRISGSDRQLRTRPPTVGRRDSEEMAYRSKMATQDLAGKELRGVPSQRRKDRSGIAPGRGKRGSKTDPRYRAG